MKRARVAAIGVTMALVGAGVRCIPAYEFGASQLDGGGPADARGTTFPTQDGAADALESTPDGGASDAPIDTDFDAPTSFPATPTTLLTNAIATESGNAQQQHLIFAKNSQRWWFFYIDADPIHLKTKWSIDFVTWTDGASLTLPMGHGGEGRNFSVAYKDFSGHDVIHAATSLHDPPARIVYDTRATIAGSAITWGTPSLVHDFDNLDNVDGGQTEAGSQSDDGCDPDGVGVAIGASGRVYVATSWVTLPGEAYCDSNFATSLAVDDGTTWDAGFQAPLFHITVNDTTHARQIIALSTGNMLAGWDTADDDPPSDVTWGSTSGASWIPESEGDPSFFVFPQPNYGSTFPQVQEKNDWSFCRIDDNDIHAVHRKYQLFADGGSTTQSNTFEHYRFSGSNWSLQGTLTDDVGIPGSGVVLLTNGTSLMAATIAQDSADSVRYATWNGTTWSAWSSLVGPDAGAATRNFVSGTNCADPTHPALLWTEGAGAPYRVIAVPVSGLFP